MAEHLQHVRHGFGSVRPYVYGRLGLWDLVKDTFGTLELERHQVGPKAFHIEAKIGDSVIVLEIADPPHPHGSQSSIYVSSLMLMPPIAALSSGAQARSPRQWTSLTKSVQLEFGIPLVTRGGSRPTAHERAGVQAALQRAALRAAAEPPSRRQRPGFSCSTRLGFAVSDVDCAAEFSDAVLATIGLRRSRSARAPSDMDRRRGQPPCSSCWSLLG